ncbi:MAG: hypothetical protein ACRDQA_22960 [Nocardioidaceae bacterium]
MSTTRDEVHRLVDAVPEERLAAIGEPLRAAAAAGRTAEEAPQLASQPLRTFASAGALSDEHDLAERAEEMLGTEPGTAA